LTNPGESVIFLHSRQAFSGNFRGLAIMLRKKRFWFGLVITLLFLFLVFRKVDFHATGLAMAQADYRWLLPAFSIYIFGYFVRVFSWKYLMESIKPLGWRALLPSLILGFMVNNVLPARVGEFVRAYILGKQEGVSKSSVFATVLMQRLYDGLVMVLFAVIILSLHHIHKTASNAQFVGVMNAVVNVTAVLFICLFILLFAMITWKEFSTSLFSRLIQLLPVSLRPKAEKITHSFIDGLSVLRNHRDSLLVFVFSFAAWTCEAAAYYFIMRAFNMDLPLYVAGMLMAVVNLGIMIPSSPGYIGPFEFFGIGTLLLFGINKSVSLPCILVIHSMVWLPITLWGFYYMWTMKLSFKEMKAAAPGESIP
jgi:uncharacterized protein (TIRG00374 family)